MNIYNWLDLKLNKTNHSTVNCEYHITRFPFLLIVTYILRIFPNHAQLRSRGQG